MSVWGDEMKLFEYQGKQLFRKYGIPTPKGVVINKCGEVKEKLEAGMFPAMAKAQVLTGGRGKAGGVKNVDNLQETEAVANELLGSALKDCRVWALLVEERLDFAAEYYLAITLDRGSRMPVIMFSAHGGIDIEDVAKNHSGLIARVIVDPLIGLQEFYFSSIFKQARIEDPTLCQQLKNTIHSLYDLFNDYDCMLVEINPLMRLADGSIIAADAKVDIDDSGVYRHPDLVKWQNEMPVDILEKQARDVGFLYIDIDSTGVVGVISNGSGMIMSCVDGIAAQGGKVNCAIDLGGGATAERVAEGIRILSQNKHVKALLISIFGGITRCNEIAGGVLKAVEQGELSIPIVVKLDGTKKEEGMELLTSAKLPGIIIGSGLQDASVKIMDLIK